MKRLLVTGGSGYLGAWLRHAAPAHGWEVHATYFTHPIADEYGSAHALDLTDASATARLVAELRPSAIIHTACSNRTDAHIAAIVPAAHHLARAAREHGARLVHLSTDLVFDGEHAPYDDDSPLAPRGAYGRAKAEAEAAVLAAYPEAAIGRPSLIWALDPLDRQTGWLVDGMRRGQPITLFTDEVRCPVHLPDLAAAVLELAARPELAGPFNLGGAQALSRWDFGLRLLQALGLPRASHVLPGTVAESGLDRARDLRLTGTRARAELRTALRGAAALLDQPRTRQPRYCEG